MIAYLSQLHANAPANDKADWAAIIEMFKLETHDAALETIISIEDSPGQMLFINNKIIKK